MWTRLTLIISLVLSQAALPVPTFADVIIRPTPGPRPGVIVRPVPGPIVRPPVVVVPRPRPVPVVPRPVPVPAPAPVPQQIDVWVGMSNPAQVRLAQAALNYFGFNAGVVDGVVGPQTRSAIRAYQRSLGHVATGILRQGEGRRLILDFRDARGLSGTAPGMDDGAMIDDGTMLEGDDTAMMGDDSGPAPLPGPAMLDWHIPSDPAETAWLARFYSNDYQLTTGEPIDWSNPPFLLAVADLDGNPGNPTLLVHWTDDSYCQSGACQLDIWYFENEDYRPAGQFVGTDVMLAETEHMGFTDLRLDGILLRWNGTSYAAEGEGAANGTGVSQATVQGLTIRPPADTD